MKKLKTVATTLSMLMTLGVAGAASAQIFTGFYDFSDSQYADDFTDVRRGSKINGGAPDLGGTSHTALNFTGQAGPAGDTWLTKWTPGGASAMFNGRCGTGVAASILIHPFNNRKGAGLVALLNDVNPGDKGLAVIVYDNGNTDAIQLATIDPFTGKLAPVPHPFNAFPLFARIKENAWYVVLMELTVDLAYEGHSLLVEAAVISLQDPKDPASDFDQVIGGMRLRTPLEALGLQPQGQVGIMASAISAVVDSSVTNWVASEGFEGPCSE
jgi:hypothetical protein